MLKARIFAISIIIISVLIGVFVYTSETHESDFGFRFGLDLSGGTHLTYNADTSNVPNNEIRDAMASLRDVIERRVNLFGVSEPIVQVEEGGVFAGETDHRLIVELPGITDVEEAVALIGETPLLEFRLQKTNVQEIIAGTGENVELNLDTLLERTGLTGSLLERATLQFGGGAQITTEPVVGLQFNNEGAELFEEITTNHVGEVLAIFLDGELISSPIIEQGISGGRAQINGNFTAEEARELVRNLNYGALPLPIELIGSQSIGASLGSDVLADGVRAALWGLIIVAVFLIVWYRLPGLISVIALAVYILLMLAAFKLLSITLTAAGIAGFILSIGMAVDANVLIFERFKEELRNGRELYDAIIEGFKRAWLSIRDSNLSSLITAIILFWFGTSLIEGFALVFGLGIIVSMITAISVTRTLLLAVTTKNNKGGVLFGSGITKK